MWKKTLSILMDYNKSMGDGVIPDNKVLRSKNRQCYRILDPMFWGEISIDRCLFYRVMTGMLQQRTYGKVLPNLQERGRDIRLYVDNIEK
jgi:hypothetical protein